MILIMKSEKLNGVTKHLQTNGGEGEKKEALR